MSRNSRTFNHITISFLFIVMLLFAACNESPPPSVTLLPDPTVRPSNTATPFPSQTQSAGELTPTQTPESPTPTLVPPWFEGVFADFPEDLATLKSAEIVTGQLDSSLPTGRRFPDHSRYLIDGWPINDLAQQPRILAFPAKDYASVNVLAQIEIEQLNQLINSDQPFINETHFPFLPVPSNPPLFTAQPRRLSFQSGQGIRQITWLPPSHSGEPSPNFLYAWHGLTSDGRGVISAVFPIQVKEEYGEFPIPKDSISQNILDQWGEETALEIEQLPAEAFEPSLTKLDQLVSSIYAQLPEPELVFDETGQVDLTIVYPRNGGETLVGRILEVEGYTQPGLEQRIEIIVTSNGNALTGQTVLSGIDGWWRSSLNIPEHIQGDVILKATGNGQSDEVNISLIGNPTQTAGSAINVLRPAHGSSFVAGYPIYTEGVISGPLVDDTLKIQIFVDNCETLVAQQSLTIPPTDINWHSALQIPLGASGQACTIISTGDYGQPSWTEMQVPITIFALPQESEQITIGNPSGLPLDPGAKVTVFGTAFLKSADSAFNININLQDGTLVEEGSVAVGEDHLWEYEFTLPADASGRIFIEVNHEGEIPAGDFVTLPVQSP